MMLFNGLAAVLAAVTLAGPDHDHGTADFAVVVEGQAVTVELRADLLDLVGFEDAPETPDQVAAIEGGHREIIADPAPFNLSAGARCTVTETSTAGGHHPTKNEPDHVLTAVWVFDCERPARLRAVTVDIFDRYTAIQKVDAVALTDSGQTGASLTPRSRTLTLQ